MKEIPIHFLPLLAAAIARMVIGALWYSPVLFLPTWYRVSGVTEAEMKAGMTRAIAIDFLGSLIMAFVLLQAVKYAGAATAAQGMAVGFFNWLGFIAVVTIATVTYLPKPLQLFFVQNGYLLLSRLAMVASLAVWG